MLKKHFIGAFHLKRQGLGNTSLRRNNWLDLWGRVMAHEEEYSYVWKCIGFLYAEEDPSTTYGGNNLYMERGVWARQRRQSLEARLMICVSEPIIPLHIGSML